MMCMLIGMNSRIRMPMFGSCFTRSEKKGMYGQFRSINKVNKRAISGDAAAGTNPYTMDEYDGM